MNVLRRHFDINPPKNVLAFCSEENFAAYSVVTFEEKLARKCRELEGGEEVPRDIPASIPIVNTKKTGKYSKVKRQLPHGKLGQTQRQNKSGGSLLQPVTRFPRRSELTGEDMKNYLNLVKTYRDYTPSATADELELMQCHQFRDLSEIVHKEQDEFMKFLHGVAKKTSDYEHIHEQAKRYVHDYLTMKCKSVATYNQFFLVYQVVSLSNTVQEHLIQENILLQLGKIPKVFMPNMNMPVKLSCEYDAISKKYPCTASHKMALSPGEWVKVPVSRDPNAVRLAKKHKADIVLSSSGLKALADNLAPNYISPWEIPVLVVDHESTNNFKHKTVYVDKPFPRTALTTRDKNLIFHKFSLKARVLNLKRSKGPSRISAATQRCRDDLRQQEPAAEALQMETNALDFGSELEQVKPEQLTSDKEVKVCTNVTDVNPCDTATAEHGVQENEILLPASEKVKDTVNELMEFKKVKDTANELMEFKSPREARSVFAEIHSPESPKSDMDNLVIDVGSASDRECKTVKTSPQNKIRSRKASEDAKPQPKTQKLCDKTDTVSSTLDEILKLQEQMWKVGGAKNKKRNFLPGSKMQQNPSLPTEKTGNFTSADNDEDYGEYAQPKNDNVTYSLWKLGRLKILLRYSVHGSLKSIDGNLSQFLHVRPKLEYQSTYGVEQITQSESCRDWLSLHIRPNCNLLRARINALTSQIVLLETVTPSSVVQPKIFKPDLAESSLATILENLCTLSTGEYLINHISGEAHFRIYRSVEMNKRGAYNLHEAYGVAKSDKDQTIETNLPFETDAVPSEPPWIPLDSNVMLPYHIQQNRIPCTFDPADSGNSHQQGGQQQGCYRSAKWFSRKKKSKKKKNVSKQ